MFINCDPSTSTTTDRFGEPKSSSEPCSVYCSYDFHSYSHQRSQNSSYNTSNRPLLTSATLFPLYLQTSLIFCLLISTTVSRSAEFNSTNVKYGHIIIVITDDGERDRFYDHELRGKLLSSKPDISKETCVEFCGYQEEAIIFSWKTHDELNPEGMGHCECLSVLHSVRLSFGSTSGFLV